MLSSEGYHWGKGTDMGEADSHADARFAAVWTTITAAAGGLVAALFVAPAVQDHCRSGWLVGAWQPDAPLGCALLPDWMYGSSAFPTALGFVAAVVIGAVVWFFAYYGRTTP